MYIAENDDAAPAAMGNLLWERMGGPERVLLAELNHAGLFVVHRGSARPMRHAAADRGKFPEATRAWMM